MDRTLHRSWSRFDELFSFKLPKREIELGECSILHWTLENTPEVRPAFYHQTNSTIISPRNFDAVVFDLDGTLINSEPAIVRAIFLSAEDFITQHGIFKNSHQSTPFEFTPEMIDIISVNCLGRSDFDMARRLFDFLCKERLLSETKISLEKFHTDLARSRKQHFSSFCENGFVTLMPGAFEFLEAVNHVFSGKPKAICTGSCKELAKLEIEYVLEPALLKIGVSFAEFFKEDCCVYCDELPRGHGKPDPYGYLLVQEKLQVAPLRILGVCDRGSDQLAILRANYGGAIIVPENLDLLKVLDPAKDKSPAGFIQALPQEERERLISRMYIVPCLDNVVFLDPEYFGFLSSEIAAPETIGGTLPSNKSCSQHII